MRLVLASKNAGKIREIERILREGPEPIEVLGLDRFPGIPDIPETGASFTENALLKARAVAERTGLVSLADDSGLEVDALNGAPGVRSARYSGEGATDEANNAKLLAELEGVPPQRRSARFRCVLAAWAPGGQHLVASGAWEGSIAQAPRGEHGFGYDPLFVDPASGLTAAQMDQAAKNALSHRGKALQDLLTKWPGFLERVGPERLDQPGGQDRSTG